MELSEVRANLRSLGKTQAELASYLGMAPAVLSNLLSGKRRMWYETMARIEAFLAEAERKAQSRGVAESARAPFAHKPPVRFITLEEAIALKAKPAPKLPAEERERIIQELIELGNAYRALPTVSTLTEDEILGYAEDGLPEQ